MNLVILFFAIPAIVLVYGVRLQYGEKGILYLTGTVLVIAAWGIFLGNTG